VRDTDINTRWSSDEPAAILHHLVFEGNSDSMLQPSSMDEAKKVAKVEGVAIEQLINVPLPRKCTRLRTEECLGSFSPLA
jgi:hypothetical protein